MEKEQFDVIYEDNHILVVNKPQNVPTQADDSQDKDLFTMAKEYIKEKYNKPGNVYLGLVHRLDRPTGGIIVFAKTSKAAARLSEQIRNGEFDKTYLTVLVGTPREKQGRLVHYLKKDEKHNIVSIVPMLEEGAKKAGLMYKVLEEKDELCLCEVKIMTGRSHQIRVQMASMQTPVFGDAKYGGDKLGKGFNLSLWATKLSFVHPTTKQTMTFTYYPPEDKTPWKFFNVDKHINISKIK